MRYFEVQNIAFPWILLLCAMVACAIGAELLFGLNDAVRIAIAVLVGVPSLLGLTHATGTCLFAVIRADLRRNRRAS